MTKTVLDFLPQLEEALDLAGNTHNVLDVADALEAGRAQLWVNGDGLLITQIVDHPRGRELVFWLAAGGLESILESGADIYEWGRSIGCRRATIIGRKGWAKPLASQGWEPNGKLMYYEKDLLYHG